jgi:hypothetical protein
LATLPLNLPSEPAILDASHINGFARKNFRDCVTLAIDNMAGNARMNFGALRTMAERALNLDLLKLVPVAHLPSPHCVRSNIANPKSLSSIYLRLTAER